MNIDLHKVKKISLSDIETNGDVCWRDIIFQMKNGEELELNLFSSDFQSLIIKKQK